MKSILQRISIPEEELESLIPKIRTDGWKSYTVVSKEFDILHHCAILRDPKDSLRLLPWTLRLVVNAKGVRQTSPALHLLLSRVNR